MMPEKWGVQLGPQDLTLDAEVKRYNEALAWRQRVEPMLPQMEELLDRVRDWVPDYTLSGQTVTLLSLVDEMADWLRATINHEVPPYIPPTIDDLTSVQDGGPARAIDKEYRKNA